MTTFWAKCCSRRSAGRLQQLCLLLGLVLLCGTGSAASSDPEENGRLQEQLAASGALNVTSDTALSEGLSQGVAGLPQMARHVMHHSDCPILHVNHATSYRRTPCLPPTHLLENMCQICCSHDTFRCQGTSAAPRNLVVQLKGCSLHSYSILGRHVR